MAALTFQFGLEPFRSEFASKPETLMAALEAKVELLGAQLYGLVSEKLFGEVLQIHTGDLLASVVANAVEVTGMQFEASVEIPESSPQWIIGMTHEYGGTGFYDIEPVNAQALRFAAGAGFVFAKHVNHPPAIERSFMRTSLDEINATVMGEIEATVAEVLEVA